MGQSHSNNSLPAMVSREGQNVSGVTALQSGGPDLVGSAPGNPVLGGDLEGVDDPQTLQILAVLEVFGQQIRALSRSCRRYDQSVPPGELETILNVPSRSEGLLVHGNRLPCPEST